MSSNPTGDNFFLKFFKTLGINIVRKCQICVENEKHASSIGKLFSSVIQRNPPLQEEAAMYVEHVFFSMELCIIPK